MRVVSARLFAAASAGHAVCQGAAPGSGGCFWDVLGRLRNTTSSCLELRARAETLLDDQRKLAAAGGESQGSEGSLTIPGLLPTVCHLVSVDRSGGVGIKFSQIPSFEQGSLAGFFLVFHWRGGLRGGPETCSVIRFLSESFLDLALLRWLF